MPMRRGPAPEGGRAPPPRQPLGKGRNFRRSGGGSLADVRRFSVNAKELRIDVEQTCTRQADKLVKVALHFSHQRRARALDRVSAGPLAPLGARQVPLEQ